MALPPMCERIVLLGFALGLTTLAASACQSGPPPADDPAPTQQTEPPSETPASVVLYRYQFNPGELTISTGKKVVFKNKDVETHRIAIPALNVDHKLPPGETWSHTFEKTGDFEVDNPALDRPMTMTIVVEEKS